MEQRRRVPSSGRAPERSPECERLVTELAATIDADNDEIAEILVEHITEVDELVRADEDVRDDLRAVARACAALLTAMTRSWSDPHVVPPPQDALTWARTLVARGLPMDAVLRVFRLGQARYREIWHERLAASSAPPEVVYEALRVTSSFTFAWVDAILQPLAAVYEEERERTMRRAHAVRAETVEAILANERLDKQTGSARLGYDLGRTHLAFIAWSEEEAGERPSGHLEDVAASVARAFAGGPARPLVLRTASRVASAWVPRGEASASRIESARSALANTGVRIAVGRPAGDLEGFRKSHEDARRARRVARLLRGSASVTLYSDVAVADLLTRDAEAARELARATLGPLAGDDEGSRRLLATLRVFYEEGQNYAKVARRLQIHHNTVAYRVRRAIELTGLSDSDSLLLQAAVEIVGLLETDLVDVLDE